MRVVAGRYYNDNGSEVAPVADAKVSVWVCRRVSDFPRAARPAGAAVAPCAVCGETVAYNPARKLDAPRVCMQCCDIDPDPIVEESIP